MLVLKLFRFSGTLRCAYLLLKNTCRQAATQGRSSAEFKPCDGVWVCHVGKVATVHHDKLGLGAAAPAIVHAEQTARIGGIPLESEVFKPEVGTAYKLPGSCNLDHILLVRADHDPGGVISFKERVNKSMLSLVRIGVANVQLSLTFTRLRRVLNSYT